jgi:alpha-galactosidase
MLQLSSKLVIQFLLSTVMVACGQAVNAQVTQGGSFTKTLPTLTAQVATGIPFSFVYEGKSSGSLLAAWKRTYGRQRNADGTEVRVTRYADPITGLEVSSEIKLFPDSDAVEILLRLRNNGSKDTPIIEKILPLDLHFTPPGTGRIVLHYLQGSLGKGEDYLPIDKELMSGKELRLVHYVLEGAKHVGGQFPFFSFEWEGGGLIGAVGWSGQWLVHTSRGSGRELTLQAGQQTTHLSLHPGESIRTPRLLLLEWKGKDRLIGHNQMRRLLVAHYLPRIGGTVVFPPVAVIADHVIIFDDIESKFGKNPLQLLPTLQPSDLTHQNGYLTPDDALNAINEENQLGLIRGMPPVGVEAYWLDAGWFEGEWPYGVGSWVPDPKKFPHGMRPLGDNAHAKGMKFLLWFEPGRVGRGSLIGSQHPEWVLHQSSEGKLGGLFNYGDPAARQWMTDLLSNRIEKWGIDIYRQDSNICPLPFWQATDKPTRLGITEIRWVEGLYAIWDELLRKHPKLMIDNANWRITGPDIEVMSRSVGSLTRSEIDCYGIPFPAPDQAQTSELSLWIPLHATEVHGLDPYFFRSAATTGACIGFDPRSKYVPPEEVEEAIEELKSLRPYWLGDYYPLARTDIDERNWSGWQFDRPDMGGGFAALFRRAKSPDPAYVVDLHGIDPEGKYEVTFARTFRAGDRTLMKGADLARLGVKIDSTPGSLLIRYRKTGTVKAGQE